MNSGSGSFLSIIAGAAIRICGSAEPELKEIFSAPQHCVSPNINDHRGGWLTVRLRNLPFTNSIRTGLSVISWLAGESESADV
jgi:hypothetical protein